MAQSTGLPAPAPRGKALPSRANLEHLKNQAKRRLAELRQRDPNAKLADAQHALAKDYGLASWRKLKAHVESMPGAVHELVQAVRVGDVATMRRILGRMPELANACADRTGELKVLPMDTKAMRLLHLAVREDQVEAARVLLAHGADPDLRNADGRTPLHDCLELGRHTIEQLLRDAGATIDICSAAACGDIDRVRALLDADPSLMMDMSTHMPPLGWASFGRKIDIARLLIERGAKPEAFETIWPAAQIGAADYARAMIDLGVDPNEPCGKQHRTAMHACAMMNYTDDATAVAEVLLDAGADPNAQDVNGLTPLHLAMIGKHNRFTPAHQKLVDLLLSRGAHLELLGDNGNIGRCTPLHLACFSGADRLPAVAVLLRAGADPNVISTEGSTPLSTALAHGEDAIVAALLAAGARPSLHDLVALDRVEEVSDTLTADTSLATTTEPYFGYSLLSTAKSDAMRTRLLELGVRRHVVEAAWLGMVDDLRQQLDADGLLVHARDLKNRTPLHAAAAAGRREAVELLAARGADLAAEWVPGWTAAVAAERRGHGEIAAFLRDVASRRVADLSPEILKAFGEAIYRDRGDVEAVRKMLDEHPQLVNSRPWAPKWEHTPIEAVAGMCVWHRPKMREMAKLLAARGATCDLPTLARCGLAEEVARYLDAQPQALDAPDAQGRTALYRATCVYGSFEEGEAVSKLLIDRGATVDICSAATLGMVERVRELLRAAPSLAKTYDGDGMTALHWAVRQRRSVGDNAVTIARLLLDAGADVAAVNRQEDGMHPIHHCGEWMATPDTADLLIERGADVNARAQKNRWTPLDYAVDRNRMRMIEYFRARGGKRSSEIDRPDDTPARFLKAVWESDAQAVREMLAADAKLVEAVAPHPQWGGRPQSLHLTIERGDREMFDLLLDAGSPAAGDNREYDGWSPLMLAIHWKRDDMRDELVRRGAPVGLIPALMLGDDARVEDELRRNPWAIHYAIPNRGTPLHFARTRRAAELLLDAGVDMNHRDKYGNTALQAAVKLGDAGRDVVALLTQRGGVLSPVELARTGDLRELQRRAAPDTDRGELLFAAVEAGRVTVVRWLIRRGVDMNQPNDKGTTPLHAAAWQGRMPIVKLLVEAGADVHALDGEYHATPAQWAQHNAQTHVRPQCLPVAAYLEKQMKTSKRVGKPAKAKDWKPIMDAAYAGDPRKIQSLLKAGADPNVLSPTNHHHRPLHRAIERKKTAPRNERHEEVVRVLLAAGADPHLRGTHGQHTALQLAAIDSPRFVRLLLDHFKPLDFFHACVMLDAKRVAALLGKDAALASKRDENEWLPLHYVAASRLFDASPQAANAQLRLAGLLLDAGADVNGAFGYDGKWPIPVLFYACGYHNNPGLTEYLLQRGAVPYDNESVYHASDEGHAECLAVIERHADARKLKQECTKCLRTQMHWGNSRGAAWLLAHGADPNSLHPETGHSALHAAAKHGAGEKVIALLLRHGADPRRKSRDGHTALELATILKRQRVLEQLRRFVKG